MNDHRQALGRNGEEIATRHLEHNGYTILARNWRGPERGELDIIARSPAGDEIVFVEVRSRRGPASEALAWALESIDARKQERLLALAQSYLEQTQAEPIRWRIDVIAVTFTTNRAQIEHLPNAVEW